MRGVKDEIAATLRILMLTRSGRTERWPEVLREEGYSCEIFDEATAGLTRLEQGGVDLLVWDSETPGPSPEEELERGRVVPRIPTILIQPRSRGTFIAGARRPGLVDVLLKPIDGDALVEAVDEALSLARARRMVAELRRTVSHAVASLAEVEELLDRKAGGAERRGPLSDREEEIALALAKGHRVAEIAGKFGISPHTVRNHFKAIFRKLEVHSQVELLAKLRELKRPGDIEGN
jgi:two-component system nitrate/nitrite response regulator NarL